MSDDMQVTLSGEPTQEQKPRYKREEWLREQYVEQGKSMYEIADMADCSAETVRVYLNKHGIETRTRYKQISDKIKREEWLREQYVEQRKTTSEIADMTDCTGKTVCNYLNKYGIEIRTGGWPQPDKLKDKDWLREQYVEQAKTTSEIADMADCGHGTVSRYLHKNGIEVRSRGKQTSDKLRDEDWLREQYVERRKTTVEIADMADCGGSTLRRYLNKHDIEIRSSGEHTSGKLRDEDWLREQYVERRKTTVEIADMADCCNKTVCNYLNKYGIEIRPPPTDLSGADHPNYAGGHAEYGPGWNDGKKRAVRDRDGNACRNCDMSQEQHRRQYDQRLHVHHIKKAREFDDADKRNAMSNLVTLCCGCHRGHFERIADTGLQPQIPGVNYPDD